MTVPNGPILFNNSTGSDTAASGLGPATAVSGTGADLDATSTVDLSADAPDLSGVSAGDLLWVDTSSGRQFSIIASVDDGADTVTCDDAFAVTESGRDWGIGGKRQTLSNINSRKLLDNGGNYGDAYGGWTIQMESGFTDTITSTIRIRRSGSDTVGPITLQGDPVAAVRPVLTANFNDYLFITGSGHGHQFKNFDAINTHPTKSASGFVKSGSGGAYCVIQNVRIGDATDYFWKGILQGSGVGGWRIEDVDLTYCASNGVEFSGVSSAVINCRIHSCGGDGIKKVGNGPESKYLGNLIHDNSGSGINLDSGGASPIGSLSLHHNIIRGNGSDGVRLNSTAPRLWSGLLCTQNIITSNGGYAINCPEASDDLVAYHGSRIDRNAFYSNTSGQMNIVSNGPNDITLTADPFVDAANGDFNINNTAGGGALLRAATITLPG